MVRLILELLCLCGFYMRFVDAALYKKYPGYWLQTCTESFQVSSITVCVARCSASGDCLSGSHVRTTGRCCLSDRHIYQQGASFVHDPNAVYFQSDGDSATDGEWSMVFRGVSGNGQNVYDAILNTGTYHDYPLDGASTPITCWTTSASGSCADHLRSKLLDMWDSGEFTPTKVKFALYENGAEVANVIFNGVGSTLHTWFDRTRVISSSFSDLTPSQTYNCFSIAGKVYPKSTRRFYVSQSHNGCVNDWGWIVALEAGWCEYETVGTFPVFPVFLYAPSASVARWNASSEGKADILAVFIQL